MLSPRWRKIARDFWNERGRVLLMTAAITVSLVAVGAVLGAYAVLTREISAGYLATRPASATLEIPAGADEALVAQARQHPLVREAEAREVVRARAKVGNEWRRMLLFVIDDFNTLRLNTFRSQSGAWPPPEGTMLLERSAVEMVAANVGQRVRVKTPLGEPRDVTVTGLVHDPGLAPAWQERSGYGYITRATLAALGEPPLLGELRIELQGEPTTTHDMDGAAREVAAWLGSKGHVVTEIRVPPPRRHPHQAQMTTLLVMLLCFGTMALLLSAVLAATSLAALLARQVREIGVMKAIGARAGQIAALYAVLTGLIGAGSALLSIPLGVVGARYFSLAVSRMLNFELVNASIPLWVFAVQGAAGVLVPLGIAAIPIRRASRRTIREAMDDHGVSQQPVLLGATWLPTPLRSALRRPARLALTLGLLATSGAMFIMSTNVKEGWEAMVGKVYETRSYDIEVRLQGPPDGRLADAMQAVEGIRSLEAWRTSPCAFGSRGEIDVVRTYPDRGHGSMAVMAPPADMRMVRFPLQSGRWLVDGDEGAVVLNHIALAQAPWLRIGDDVTLSIQGNQYRFRLVGVVQEIGSPATAYVTPQPLTRALGTGGGDTLVRITTSAASAEERWKIVQTLDAELVDRTVAVESIVPLAELRTAIGDHIRILIRSLIALAAVVGVVGTLGLTSTMSVSIVERTREIAVMKVVGAAPGRIIRMLALEGVSIGLLSWLLAVGLSIPLTWLVGVIIGSLGFLAPLPLVVSPVPIALWLACVCAASLAATALPARRAALLNVRNALAQT